MHDHEQGMSRRGLLALLAGLGVAGAAFALRRSLMARLSRLTRRKEFAATPPLVPHDPTRDRRTLYLARGGTPAENIDAVLAKLGGLGTIVGRKDVVLVKVAAQWWNQGMTNVAAVKRLVEQLLELPAFSGEVLVIENTHFRRHDGSGLARAFTRPSERNVDVPGWKRMLDLAGHFHHAPVSFVGLVDAGPSRLAGDHWHDPDHEHGVYGGDGRGPILEGEDRDGYVWDFGNTFRLKRSLVDHAQTPLTWPVFTSPRSGLVVDLRHGLFRRAGGKRVPVDDRKLRFINMTTANEHASTGMTGCCKSAMGLVDMSAGAQGTHPLVRDYQSVHYFGAPDATWRMAGPLAHFARHVIAPDLYLSVAEWIGVTPAGGLPGEADHRLEAAAAHQTRTILAGTDPVAMDVWLTRNLLMPAAGANRALLDLDDENSKVVKFLRYYREIYGSGTLDEKLVSVV